MPKVSIVVPVYNAHKYVGQCVESILGQTLEDIELICVNDGSSDNSLEILQEYAAKDPRMKIIDKPNSGYGASMNRGLQAATGEYFGIVDSDDYILPEMCERYYRLASENALDFVRGGYYKFYSVDGEEKRSYWTSMGEKYRHRVYCPRTTQPFWMSAVVIPSGIYRIDFLRENGIGFNESPGAAFQDHGFWFQTHILADRVMFVDEAYYMYRFDNSDSSIVSIASVQAMEREYDYIKEFVDRHKDLGSIVDGFYWKARWANTTLAYSRVMDKSFGPETLQSISDVFLVAREDGELNTMLFDKNTKREMDLLLDSPKEYCKQYQYKYAWAAYRDYVKTIRDGKAMSRVDQYNWFAQRYGHKFALSLVRKKYDNASVAMKKKRATAIPGLRDVMRTIQANQAANTRRLSAIESKIVNLEKKNEMMFWWAAKEGGETMEETQRRVYSSMPPAEGHLRERQVANAKLLADFKALLDEHGIQMWPMGGTMVGMLRHGGFIPWDDDLDVSMFAEDKEKLFEIVGESKTMYIEEVYWIGGSDALRCPRVTYIDSEMGTGEVDIFLWEKANYEPTEDPYVWSIRNRYHQKLYGELMATRPQWSKKSYQGVAIDDRDDRKLISEIFERNRRECVEEIGSTGTTIYGSIDMWFAAGNWHAVYAETDLYPFRDVMFEGAGYQVPQSAELFLTMQYGDWLALPTKVTPNHGG